jgi:hypothetical protein
MYGVLYYSIRLIYRHTNISTSHRLRTPLFDEQSWLIIQAPFKILVPDSSLNLVKPESAHRSRRMVW